MGFGLDPAVLIEPARPGTLPVTVVLAWHDEFWLVFGTQGRLESVDFVSNDDASQWAFDVISLVAQFGVYRLGLLGIPIGRIYVSESHEESARIKRLHLRRGKFWEPWAENQ